MTDVILAGITFTDADFSEFGFQTSIEVDGVSYPRWQALFVAGKSEFSAILAAGATSATSMAVSAGSKAFTLSAAATMAPGLYMVYRASEAAAPVNFMFGTLAAGITAGTEFTVTVGVGAFGGSGTYTDWVMVPVIARRASARSVSGNDTQLTADLKGTVYYTGGGGHTQTLIAAATAGLAFRTTFVHDGTGAWTVGAFSLTAGQALTLESDGADWLPVAAVGYGATPPPLLVHPTVQTGNFTIQPGYIYRVNTTGGAITGTIADDAADGALFGIIDHAWTFGTYACTVDANTTAGDTIRGGNTYALNVSGLGATFARTHATNSWGMI